MALAIAIAILLGGLSCVPFRWATLRVRTVNPTHSGSLAGLFLAPIAASFVILGAGIILCGLLARDLLLAFSAVEVVTFLVVVIAFGLNRKRKQ